VTCEKKCHDFTPFFFGEEGGPCDLKSALKVAYLPKGTSSRTRVCTRVPVPVLVSYRLERNWASLFLLVIRFGGPRKSEDTTTPHRHKDHHHFCALLSS